VVLTDRERQALRRVRRVEIGAYDWYLRGRHLSAQASGRNLEAGRQMFLRAIELDPDFVPALAGLADCCAWLYLCWGERERELTTADEASRRAVALAPDSADAHAVRAMAYYLTGRPEEMDTEHLQEALDAGYRHCEWIVCEPSFEALRREPRAQTLLARWCGPEPLGAEARALRGGSPLALSQPGRA
jgi:adenylate cyclase